MSCLPCVPAATGPVEEEEDEGDFSQLPIRKNKWSFTISPRMKPPRSMKTVTFNGGGDDHENELPVPHEVVGSPAYKDINVSFLPVCQIAWELLQPNLKEAVLWSFLTLVLTAVSFGFLFVPMLGGLFNMFLYTHIHPKEKAPTHYMTVFMKHHQRQFLLNVSLVWWVYLFVCVLVCPVGSLVLVFGMYWIHLMLFNEMTLGEAFEESFLIVRKSTREHIWFCVIFVLMSSVFLFLIVVSFVLWPISVLTSSICLAYWSAVWTAAYVQVTAKRMVFNFPFGNPDDKDDRSSVASSELGVHPSRGETGGEV